MPTPEQHALLSASSAERWSPIAGWEGLYEVSTCGRVKSLARLVDGGHGLYLKKEAIRKPGTNGKKGYCQLGLHYGNINKRYLLHRLVANAFLPNPENKSEVNHIDGNKRNNQVTNLEWVTPSENRAHAGHTGLRARGEKHGHSKLSGSDIRDIRQQIDAGAKLAELSERYGVCISNISMIKNRKIWRHID